MRSLSKPALVVLIAVFILAGYIVVKLLFPSPAELAFNYAARQKTVKLYFVNQDGKLQIEKREIQGSTNVSDDVMICVTELAKGPKEKKLYGALPKYALLREVYIDDNRCAYLDFSKNILTDAKGGTTAEKQLVFSLVNTVLENFGQITSVRILLEGEELKTLYGHLDVNRPLWGRTLE